MRGCFSEYERQLQDYLVMLKNCTTNNMKHATGADAFHYKGVGDFLLQHGQFFVPRELPRYVKRGVIKECFRNSANYAWRNRVRYIEGYALSVIPVHHAWCADADGNILELTWETPGLAYLGVEFSPLRTVGGAVLDNWMDGYSLYRQPWKGYSRE